MSNAPAPDELLRILIPARGNSTRILQKNLQELVPGKSLLQWSIELYQLFLPGVPIHVATECPQISKLAVRLGCLLHGRTLDDIQDKQNDPTILNDFLACYPGETVIHAQCTSPFTFYSELMLALQHPTQLVYSAYQGTLHTLNTGEAKSQALPCSTVITGNFWITRGVTADVACRQLSQASPVSWLSAIDVNTPDDLRQVRFLAKRISQQDLLAGF